MTRILTIITLLLFLSFSASGQTDIWTYAGEKPSDLTPVGTFKPQDKKDFKIRMFPFCANINIVYNDVIYDHCADYVEIHTKTLERVMNEFMFYSDSFRKSFQKAGVPEYLSVYAIPATMMNNSVETDGRKGIWQLDSLTAIEYGLVCNEFIDQRLCQEKSAEVFARNLRRIYKKHNSWSFAIIELRYGHKTLQNAKVQARNPNLFWDVYPYLPSDAQEFLMNLVSTINAYYFRNEYGIKLKKRRQPKTDVLTVNERIDFNEYQHTSRIPLNTLRSLNPQYHKDIVPADSTQPLDIIVPFKKIKEYSDNKNIK